MKKWGFAAIMLLVIAGVVFIVGKSMEDKVEEYVIVNEALYSSKGNMYSRSEMNLSPIALDKKIGKTNDGGQVFSIEDADSKDWICFYCGGELIVYRAAQNAPILWVDEMNVDHIDIYDAFKLKKDLSVNDKSIIDEVVNTMTDENIVIGEIKAESLKKMVFSSADYSGLSFVCFYIIDKNDEAYIYDGNNGNMWKVKGAIFER